MDHIDERLSVRRPKIGFMVSIDGQPGDKMRAENILPFAKCHNILMKHIHSQTC